MNKIKILKIICIIFFILMAICGLKVMESNFYSKNYEVLVTSENKSNLIELIKEYYNKPEEITKIQYQPLLGDGDLYLYKNNTLAVKRKISESREIVDYIFNNGYDANKKFTYYFFYLLVINLVLILSYFLLKKHFIKEV